MSSRRLILSALLFAAMTWGIGPVSTVTWAAPCTDADGDGYGHNCCLGEDCNDADPAVHNGAFEICDGRDNNCDGSVDSANGQFTVDAGMSCNSGGLGVCADGIVRCQGGALQCVPKVTPGAEVCNGLDDDCDGIVDDVGGADADGDGASAGCDCDDSNPLLSAPLQTDGSGRHFCLQLDPIQAFADVPNTPITVRGFHESGIGSLRLLFESNGTPVSLNCNGATSCVLSSTLTQAFEGPRYVRAQLLSSGGVVVRQIDRRFKFGCQGQSCPQDPAVGDYVAWLRAHGYPECISSYYLDRAQDPLRLERLKMFLGRRPSGLTQQFSLEFWDIVPTDAHATFSLLGPGQGGRCSACGSWPDWCPNSMPADYTFVERHFERTFGVNFTFVYRRMDIPYATTLPNFHLNSQGFWDWDYPTQFLSQFPPHAIIHYAMDKLNGSLVQNLNRTGSVVETTFEPNKVNGIPGGTGGYTHEWGHSWSLPHSFVDAPFDIYAPKVDGSDTVGLDGIMENGYRFDTRLIDPLEPMERYALEPSNGFTDQSTFASAYSAGIVGTYRMPTCGTVDPAISAAQVTSSTLQDWNIDVTLADNGTLPVGYVSLEARDGSASGPLLDQRTIGRIAPGAPSVTHYTLPKSSVTGDAVVFLLDGANVIREANAHVPDDSESNNQKSLTLRVNLTELPNSDAGPNQGSPTPVGPHYLNVRDDPNDGDATIISFPGGGQKEVFTTADQLLDTDVITSVKVRWVAKKGSGSNWQGKAGLVLGTQEYYGPTRTLATAYTLYEEAFPSNPATNQAWTIQDVRSAKLVYQQVAITTQKPEARLTEIVLVLKVERHP